MTTLDVRLLGDLEEFSDAARVLNTIWGAQQVARELLRALAWAGNPVIGAFHGSELLGVSAGFVGTQGGLHLHSHITGVLPGREHGGIGYALKLAQRDWCRRQRIERVTWTFDPMIARNAYFNLHKLGATAEEFLPDFYGSMEDEINRGELADRLEAHWMVDSERVERAIDGRPMLVHTPAAVVPVPDDYLRLRESDPARAKTERSRLRDEMAAAFSSGLVATGFSRGRGYLFEERPRETAPAG